MLYGDEVLPPARRGARGIDKMRRKAKDFARAIGERPKTLLILIILAVLFILFILAEGVFQYNRFQTWDTTVQARAADVDRELKRRENLIPGVVALAGRYAAYERGMFQYVSDARAVLQSLKESQAPGTQMSSLLEKTLSKLVALAEAYPDLKATQPVQDLISKLSETEDRVADAKKDYNAAAEQYNQYVTVFPGNMFAFIYRFKVAKYMSIEENLEVPDIYLDVTRPGPIAETEANDLDEEVETQKETQGDEQ